MFTFVDTCPVVGLKSRDVGVIVILCDILCVESATVTVCVPTAEAGTEKVATKAPEESVCITNGVTVLVSAGVPVMTRLSNFTEVIVVDGEKFDPVIRTTSPLFTVEGKSEKLVPPDEVTINCADAVVDAASVALMEYCPRLDDGTVIEPVKPPVELVVMVTGFVV